MKVPKPIYRCPLAKAPERIDPDRIKQAGWREQHILVVSQDDERLDFVEKEFVRRLGERLYGERKHG